MLANFVIFVFCCLLVSTYMLLAASQVNQSDK